MVTPDANAEDFSKWDSELSTEAPDVIEACSICGTDNCEHGNADV